jgi:hypothetical protein
VNQHPNHWSKQLDARRSVFQRFQYQPNDLRLHEENEENGRKNMRDERVTMIFGLTNFMTYFHSSPTP